MKTTLTALIVLCSLCAGAQTNWKTIVQNAKQETDSELSTQINALIKPSYKISEMNNNVFKEGETVWRINAKSKAKFLYELKPQNGRWFYIQLENGGLMETQFIEPYTNQDQQ